MACSMLGSWGAPVELTGQELPNCCAVGRLIDGPGKGGEVEGLWNDALGFRYEKEAAWVAGML